jgi:hypothetical protein
VLFGKQSVLLVLVMTWQCVATTIVQSSIKVGPDFRVKLESRYADLKGRQRLLITNNDGSRKQSIETNRHGIADVRGLPPSNYSIHIEMDPGASTNVEVNARERSLVTVPLRWPSRPPIEVRTVQGTFYLFDELPEMKQSEVDLVKPRSSRLIERVRMSENGGFAFKEVRPGLYLLGLRGSATLIGSVPVLVTPEATLDRLDLQVASSLGGPWIVDQSHCPQGGRRIVRKFWGTVQDPTGALIPNASITLLQNGSIRERLRSDAVGGFAFSRLDAGSYELTITSPGFTSLRTAIEIDPELASQRQITVRLGVGGCGTVDFGGQE